MQSFVGLPTALDELIKVPHDRNQLTSESCAYILQQLGKKSVLLGALDRMELTYLSCSQY